MKRDRFGGRTILQYKGRLFGLTVYKTPCNLMSALGIAYRQHIINDVWAWLPNGHKIRDFRIMWWRRHSMEDLKLAVAMLVMQGVKPDEMCIVRSFTHKND